MKKISQIITVSSLLLSFAGNNIAFASTAASNDTNTAVNTENAVTQEVLKVVKAVARPSMSGSHHSAAYITLHNNSNQDITILGATAFEIANNVELHTTADENGVKKMIKVDQLVVPANGDLVMQRGGIHIMLMNLKQEMVVGNKFTIELVTKEHGVQKVETEIVQM